MNPHYPQVARRAIHRCEYCHAPEAIFNFPFEIEHILAVAHQGQDDDSNLALACRSCNLFKSDWRTGQDPSTQTEVALFHPREDRWDDHFQVDRETAAVEGKTPTGRATVERLPINNAAQLEARRHWMRLGLFP